MAHLPRCPHPADRFVRTLLRHRLGAGLVEGEVHGVVELGVLVRAIRLQPLEGAAAADVIEGKGRRRARVVLAARFQVAQLKGAQSEMVRAIWCSGSAFYHNPW